MKKFISVLSLLLLFTVTSNAQMPQYYNYNTNGTNNSFPFNMSAGKMVQYLFTANTYNQPNPAPSGNISKFWFRIGDAYPLNGTYTSIYIRMGLTTLTDLPGTFYTGTMDTVWRRTNFSINAAGGTWYSFILDNPFPYNNSQSLVVEIGQCGWSGPLGFSVCNSTGSGLKRAWSVGGCPFAYFSSNNSIMNSGIDISGPPPAPTLLLPVNGRQGVELTPLLDWTAVQTATSYNVKVSLDTSFVTNVVDTVVVPDSVRVGPLAPETWHYWKVRGLNNEGPGPFSATWSFRTGPLGISKNGEIPKQYQLYPNYPNPFNPFTLIRFDLPERADLKLIIYNSLGQEIEILLNGEFQGGSYTVQWDGTNFPSGVYFYKLESNKFTDVMKMLLVK